MKISFALVALFATVAALPGPTGHISVGPRPYFLIEQLPDGDLKTKLESCADQPMEPNSFAIAHRGACLQFPEHSRESAMAAARLGAGTIECDVTFTKDKELVCRHGQDDLHYTTNVLLTPLAAKCTQPFKPYDPATKTAASALCRTSDFTLAEFKTLKAKMEGKNSNALTVEDYVKGTPRFRTELYAGASSGTLMTLEDSIELNEALGVMHTPEAKEAVVPLPFDGFTRNDFVQKIVDTYKKHNVDPSRVFLQSFIKDDILYVIKNEPAFGKNAVYLDSMNTIAEAPTAANFTQFKKEGINIWAPPLFALLAVKDGKLVASEQAKAARAAGLDIISWSLDRSGVMADKDHDLWYYQTVNDIIKDESIIFQAIHIFVQDLGLKGLFADWSAETAYYANCFGYGYNPVKYQK
ncbi:Glycerophosphodiester phosphodiesterase GDPDL3 [Aphanomyces cochlioides]|nr:Glycerophosphodiester phosphodiesterase GDPDL3 [Aphanomyces cochlioides]